MLYGLDMVSEFYIQLPWKIEIDWPDEKFLLHTPHHISIASCDQTDSLHYQSLLHPNNVRGIGVSDEERGDAYVAFFAYLFSHQTIAFVYFFWLQCSKPHQTMTNSPTK